MSYWLTTKLVMQHFGVCSMTVDRWLKNEAMGFPKPMLINGRRYWERDKIEAWTRRQSNVTLALPAKRKQSQYWLKR